ncbi:hypothetical protein TNCV_4505821 [Trichonephila clavipes]|nr:hypothetical protein TNCV_4505821 [Trichonephila clavipes]
MTMTNARCQCALTTMLPNTDVAILVLLQTKPEKTTSSHSCGQVHSCDTIEDTPFCNAASRAAAVMVSKRAQKSLNCSCRHLSCKRPKFSTLARDVTA